MKAETSYWAGPRLINMHLKVYFMIEFRIGKQNQIHMPSNHSSRLFCITKLDSAQKELKIQLIAHEGSAPMFVDFEST